MLNQGVGHQGGSMHNVIDILVGETNLFKEVVHAGQSATGRVIGSG